MNCKFECVVVEIAIFILVRISFIVLSLVAIWEVTGSYDSHSYWLLAFLLIPLVVESYCTLIEREGREYRWVSPSVLCFLVATIPSIWLLELNMLDRRMVKAEIPEEASSDDGSMDQAVGFHFPDHLSRETQVSTVEQFQLIMVVLSRWILPKGSFNRDELSLMLLTYVGIMADIVEFFSDFQQIRMINDRSLTCAVLALWTVSVLQFIFVFGSMKPRDWRPARPSIPGDEERGDKSEDDDTDPRQHGMVHVCLSTDLWVLTLMVVMMDVPFFLFRMVLIFHYGVVNHMVFFFTVKNAILILLQTYRVVVGVCCQRSHAQRRGRTPLAP